MGKHSRKRKKLLNKANIKALIEWLAILSTIIANIYSILKE